VSPSFPRWQTRRKQTEREDQSLSNKQKKNPKAHRIYKGNKKTKKKKKTTESELVVS
jgi:hypothetical protein